MKARALSFLDTKIFFFLLGFLISLITLSWMVFLLPLSWIGFPGLSGFFILVAILSVLSVVGGLSFLLFFYFFKKARTVKNYYIVFLLFLLTLVLTEIVKTMMLGILLQGEHVGFSLHWTLLSVGYLVAFPPFIVWANPLHIYSLSLCFGYVVFLVYLLCKREIRIFAFLSLVFVVITIFLYIQYPLRPVNNVYTEKITVLPEGVSAFEKNSRDLPKEHLFIDGGYENVVDTGEAKKYNISNYFFNGTKVKVVQKEFLMPFGEYMPILFKPLAMVYLNRNGNEKDYTFWEYMRFGYAEGVNESRTFTMDNGFNVATLLCSEILSFDILSKIKKERPDVVYLQGSYLNFNNSKYFQFFLERWTAVAEQYTGVHIILVQIH